MTSAEEFLLLWAVLATVFAVVFHGQAKKLRFAIFLMQMGIRMVGEGKAKVVIDGANVKVMEA